MREVVFFFLLILFSTIFLTACEDNEELIAYNDNNSIILIDFKGQIKEKIQLPRKIKNEFNIKEDVVCYVGEDGEIYWYNWKNCNEQKLISGPYLYKKHVDKNVTYDYGSEIYFDIDFSIERGIIVFSIRPEYLTYTYNSGNIEKHRTHGLTRIGLLDIKKKIFIKVTEENNDYTPTIYKDKIVRTANHTIVISDMNGKNEVSLYETYRKYFNINDKWSPLRLLRIIDGTVIFFEYGHNNDLDAPVIKKICTFAFTNQKFEVLYNFQNCKNKDFLNLKYLKSISRDLRYLLNFKNGQIYLVDLKHMKKILLKEIENKKASLVFYSINHMSKGA